ncbi:zinc ribbon domain-containing protein [Halobaculum rubrum]|uniref:zinc ribbon domain-containing protein n=1 Tax=Halobaculum rubrum TaxID=2872158 RepID=UPI001CA424D5|nr:zinc ribbon domain-containing protein [Halobaculum rubrum]QZX99610.1 hypothetical protein K6T25_00415 [Halobaculum rubrum]
MTVESTNDEGPFTDEESPDESSEEQDTDESTGEPNADRAAVEPDPDEVTEEPEPDESDEPDPDEFTEEPEPDESDEAEQPQKGPNEMYCSSCGAVVKKRAEICPECGVATSTTSGGVSTTGSSSRGVATGGSSTEGGKTKYTAVGVVSGLAGFVVLPIVFAPISMYCGYKVYQNYNETHGIALIAWGALSLIAGMAAGAMVFA